MKREIIDASQLELVDQVVDIKRVTKVVKGGRNMRFTALVVVGDKNGHEILPQVLYLRSHLQYMQQIQIATVIYCPPVHGKLLIKDCMQQ